MRRAVYLGLLVLVGALFLGTPAIAEENEDHAEGTYGSDDKNVEFYFDGEVRTRWEFHSNTTDALDRSDANPDADDDFDFFPYRVRVGMGAEFKNDVSAYAEIQNYGYFGNFSNDGSGGGSSGMIPGSMFYPLGLGESDGVELYQGWAQLEEIGGSGATLRIGRMEHTLGNELQIGDADFYNGQVFDGLRLNWAFENWDFDLFTYVIEENDISNLTAGNGTPDNDVTFSGFTTNVELTESGQFIEPYLLYLRDGEGMFGGEILTIGALYGKAPSHDDNGLDWGAEFAYQTGEKSPDVLGGIDVKAYVFEGTLGYNWVGNSHRRISLGYFMSSGDDDPTDGEDENYNALFTDLHENNRLGWLDLVDNGSGVFSDGISNMTDISLAYDVAKKEGKHMYRVALHSLSLTEENVAGNNDIGLELDLRYDYQYSKHAQLEVGLANLFSGDVMDDVVGAAADDILRVWGQVRVTW